jgi:Ca2+-binding RTX toxin-like protein
MTTYTYSAIIVNEDSMGEATAARLGSVELTTRFPFLYLDYLSWDPQNPDDTNLLLNGINIRIDGQLMQPDAGSYNAELARITWGAGQSAIFLGFEFAGQFVAIHVDGDVPPVTDLASLAAFDAAITGASRVTGGDYGLVQGQFTPILVSTFASLTALSENDDFVNLNPVEWGGGRFRMRTGDDRFTGNGSAEDVYGGRGNDTLSGNGGNDTIYGETENDVVFGGTGLDSVYGGDGDDTLNGGDDYDRLFGDLGRDEIYGDAGDDELDGGDSGDRLFGGNGRDGLWGGSGTDLLSGDGGSDLIFGGDGNDRIDGGRGNDQMTGDLGADQFTFRDRSGRDVITDFSVAEGDRLMLSRALFDGASPTAAAIIATYAFDMGSATRFDFGDGDVLTLFGVSDPASLAGSITLF